MIDSLDRSRYFRSVAEHSSMNSGVLGRFFVLEVMTPSWRHTTYLSSKFWWSKWMRGIGTCRHHDITIRHNDVTWRGYFPLLPHNWQSTIMIHSEPSKISPDWCRIIAEIFASMKARLKCSFIYIASLYFFLPVSDFHPLSGVYSLCIFFSREFRLSYKKKTSVTES